MTDYAALKVPELKKLLSSKSLSTTGNKSDLISRLQDFDKSTSESKPAAALDDEIDYSDDDDVVAKPATSAPVEPAVADAAAKVATAPAAVVSAPVTTDVVADAVDTAAVAEAQPTDATSADAATVEGAATDAAAAPPAQNFALNIAASDASEEARRRAERAKRFGTNDEDEDAKKKADRAARFGLNPTDLSSTLDSALSERPLKRGRDRERTEGDNRANKRQSTDRRGRGARGGQQNQQQQRGRNDRGGRNQNNNNNNASGEQRVTRSGGASKWANVQDNPVEKAKAEARAKKFATS